jgi:hypothetical protein
MKKREAVKFVVGSAVGICASAVVGIATKNVVGYDQLSKGYQIATAVTAVVIGSKVSDVASEYVGDMVDDVCELGSTIKEMVSDKTKK